jgi:UDP-2,3-diacylglucosamine hydrolase
MTDKQCSDNNNKTLFISDLHIESNNGPIITSLLNMLATRAVGADAIYILGDLFEAWIGDDDDNPAADMVASALAGLSAAGTAVYLMHGNRDFLIGDEFARRCGGQLLREPAVIDCYGQQIALVHGDSLCTRDTEYIKFRQQVRDPAWQDAFLARPLLERLMVAQQLRQQSKEANSNKASDIMDVTHEEVIKLLESLQVSVLVHGHTHRPGIHTIRLSQAINGQVEAHRIVLGAWDQKAWVLQMTPQGYDLLPVPHASSSGK